MMVFRGFTGAPPGRPSVASPGGGDGEAGVAQTAATLTQARRDPHAWQCGAALVLQQALQPGLALLWPYTIAQACPAFPAVSGPFGLADTEDVSRCHRPLRAEEMPQGLSRQYPLANNAALEQNLENLRRNHYALIRCGSPCVTCETNVMRPQGAKRCAPSKATFPSMRSRP